MLWCRYTHLHYVSLRTSEACTTLFVYLCAYSLSAFECVDVSTALCGSVIQYLYLVNAVANIISSQWLHCLSVTGQMDTSDTKACIQLEPTEILVWLKRVSGDNPVFLDPLTFRHLVVLARSWSCQPSIYGRSVFNLQKWTLPENKERMKERKRGVEMKPVLLSECRVDLRFWTQRRMIRLRLDVSEICECDGQSHFKPSSGSVSLLWKELCKWLYVSVCGWKGRGLLLWNCS